MHVRQADNQEQLLSFTGNGTCNFPSKQVDWMLCAGSCVLSG